MFSPFRFCRLRHARLNSELCFSAERSRAGLRRRNHSQHLATRPGYIFKGVLVVAVLLTCFLALECSMFPASGFSEEITTNTQATATENVVPDSPLINKAHEAASLATSILKTIGALLLVLGLLLILMQFLRKLGMGNRQLPHGPLIRVLDTRMVAPKKHVAVLDIAGEFIAVGITDQQVSLLTSLKDNTEVSEAASKVSKENGLAQYANSFSDLLNKARHGIKKKN